MTLFQSAFQKDFKVYLKLSDFKKVNYSNTYIHNYPSE